MCHKSYINNKCNNKCSAIKLSCKFYVLQRAKNHCKTGNTQSLMLFTLVYGIVYSISLANAVHRKTVICENTLLLRLWL